ncbi:MAG: hypothetical protein IJ679_06395 [Lachnospiraceae bacterium]|nr:hypothetical protein [Lachnospiraceae bacterium]
MATEKDSAMGDLEAYNDVFADIMNVLLFGGEECVKEADPCRFERLVMTGQPTATRFDTRRMKTASGTKSRRGIR